MKFSLSHISAGFVAVLVGYTSAAAIVFQAAVAGGATPEQVSSWMWAVGIGMGISCIGLSIYYKAPIMIAWSTPGAALLVTSLPGIPMEQAIGAFLFSSVLITLCGITGWVDKLMRYIPPSLATAMLAGVLLRFGLAVFPAFTEEVLLVGAMVVTYFLGKWRGFGYTVPATFIVGVLVALLSGDLAGFDVSLEITHPVAVMPEFSISVLIGVGVPLFIITMASQNLPGVTVLRAHNYDTPVSPLITYTGILGLIFGVFGGYAFNLSAITAALCMGKDVDENPKQRYFAAIWAGVFYILAGVFGAAVAGFFAAFPAALIATIAGLALMGTIANSLNAALKEESGREAAMICFAVSAAGGSFLTVGAPFWGLVIGMIVHHLLNQEQGIKKAAQ